MYLSWILVQRTIFHGSRSKINLNRQLMHGSQLRQPDAAGGFDVARLQCNKETLPWMMSLIKDGKGQSLSETHRPMFWVTSGATRLCRLHSLCHAAVEEASRMHMFMSVFVDLKMAGPRRCLPSVSHQGINPPPLPIQISWRMTLQGWREDMGAFAVPEPCDRLLNLNIESTSVWPLAWLDPGQSKSHGSVPCSLHILLVSRCSL